MQILRDIVNSVVRLYMHVSWPEENAAPSRPFTRGCERLFLTGKGQDKPGSHGKRKETSLSALISFLLHAYMHVLRRRKARIDWTGREYTRERGVEMQRGVSTTLESTRVWMTRHFGRRPLEIAQTNTQDAWYVGGLSDPRIDQQSPS